MKHEQMNEHGDEDVSQPPLNESKDEASAHLCAIVMKQSLYL
jgi:hypothetical protein